MIKHFYILTVAIIVVIGTIKSQDANPGAVVDTTWKTGGIVSINFSQAYYEHWTAGGVPSIAGISFLKLFATYEKKKLRWNNNLDLAYGLINERDALMKKTDDKIHFDSKLGYNLGKKWYASALATFKTQFTEGYEDPNVQQVVISDFMSPAYVMISIGADYNPSDNFSFFIAPLSMKSTIVLDQDLANVGAYGVESGEWETIKRNGVVTDSTYINGKTIRYEIGAYMKLMLTKKLMENVDFQSKLELYANYFDNVGNIDVNWEGLVNMKINSALSANIRVELIYDDDIDIPLGLDENGVEQFGPRLQIKEIFGLGLSYKF